MLVLWLLGSAYCKAVHGFSGKRDEVSVVEMSGMRHKGDTRECKAKQR